MTMANLNIDFDAGLDLADVQKEATLGSNKSTWVKALTALAIGVEEGKGEYGKFYRIGEFKNASGAATAIRTIETKFADVLPAAFDLRPVQKPNPEDSTKRVSFLYAAVVKDEVDEDEEQEEVEDDEGDEDNGTEETEDDEETEEEVEETPAPRPRPRARKR